MDFVLFRDLAIALAFSILLGTSAYDKVKDLAIPDWFSKQFEKTVLAKLPGGVSLGYRLITLFEVVLSILFVASFFLPTLLPFALLGALFLFSILLFGLRITYDFQGSANMFTYFTATLVSLSLVLRSAPVF